MSTERIAYRGGYKYQLHKTYAVNIPIVGYVVEHEFIRLTSDGVLHIREGYAWDGPSGPSIDTKDFMRGSLVHDALYQLMCEGYLPATFKDTADNVLKTICLEDGMNGIRAWYVFKAVQMFGASHLNKDGEAPVEYAPN